MAGFEIEFAIWLVLKLTMGDFKTNQNFQWLI